MPATSLDLGETLAASVVPPSFVREQLNGMLRIGEVLSDTFEVRAQLGEGGMGQVYEAEDIVLRRRVAIKVMLPHVLMSIRDEARALAAMRHPSVATVYGVGQHGGIEYVVMERIHGTSLATLLESRRAVGARLEIDEAIDILTGIADGLAVVHHAGIAHRDVKPDNVMLAPGNRIVLMDFGIFQPVFDRTEHPAVSGSPPYMAPEAIANAIEPGELFLVDVYAFGVVAFELLTGQLPFVGNVLAVLNAQMTEAVPDIQALRPDAPPRLCALVNELLAKEPQARPQSMEGIAWRLRNLVRASSDVPPSRLCVLIAEDDADSAMLMQAIVAAEAPDAEVLFANNGHKALELLRQRKPHLMLLDLQLPRMNGVEVCMHVSGAPGGARDCTIVAVSSHAETRDLELLRHLGFSHYIPKGHELGARLPALIAELKSRLHAPPSDRRGVVSSRAPTSSRAALSSR